MTLLYSLCLDPCPFNWPVIPSYPIDPPVPATPVASTGRIKVDDDPRTWLRQLYLRYLYQELGDAQGLTLHPSKIKISDLTLPFAQALVTHLDHLAPPTLASLLLSLHDYNLKHRRTLPSFLTEGEALCPLEPRELALLKQVLTSADDIKAVLTVLESIELQLQIILLFTLLWQQPLAPSPRSDTSPDRPSASTTSTDRPATLLDLYTDRLAIQQALADLTSSLLDDPETLDPIATFWLDVIEPLFAPRLPRALLDRHRSKFFPDAADRFGFTSVPTLVPPTPDLAQRNAQATKRQLAHPLPPASPTLAKLLLGPTAVDRPFKRSRSLAPTAKRPPLAPREVSMGTRAPSAPLTLDVPPKRSHKRKNPSPKRLGSHQTLVLATPLAGSKLNRSVSLPSFAQLGAEFRPGSRRLFGTLLDSAVPLDDPVLVPVTPVKLGSTDDEGIPETPGP